MLNLLGEIFIAQKNILKDDYLLVNGVNLHYYRTGVQNPPMVLLHGFTDNGLCWTRVARELENKFDIIMPDLRGHGKSISNQLDYSLESASEDIIELIRFLSLERPILMGHSMGGQIATILAANHPKFIRGLILEDPAYLFKPNSFKAKLISYIFKFIIKRNMKKSEEDLRKMSKKFNSNWEEIDHITWAKGQKEFSDNNPFEVFLNLSVKVNWFELVQNIMAPSLMMISSKGILRKKEAESLIPNFKNIELVKIDNAGHNIRRDNFESFMSSVQQFLKNV